jgi:hypothetical protein
LRSAKGDRLGGVILGSGTVWLIVSELTAVGILAAVWAGLCISHQVTQVWYGDAYGLRGGAANWPGVVAACWPVFHAGVYILARWRTWKYYPRLAVVMWAGNVVCGAMLLYCAWLPLASPIIIKVE